MVVCTYCGDELDKVKVYVLEENRYEVWLDENGNLDWSVSEVILGSATKSLVQCPDCGTELAQAFDGVIRHEELLRLLNPEIPPEPQLQVTGND